MRSLGHSLAKVLFCLVSVGVFACGTNGNDGPGFLPAGEASSCKASCTAHATPTCTSECQAACLGVCSGTMAASSFPEVDSIDCGSTSVTFHEGGSELTCNP
jgi:hypothetical protein